MIAPMNIARDSCACCAFNNEYIYVFLGRANMNPRELCDVIEFYDI